MRALLSYHAARTLRKKSLWAVLALVVVGQLLLESQLTPTEAAPAVQAVLTRFLSSETSQEDFFRICLTGNQMGLGAVFLLLGAVLGGMVLCPARRACAMLPVTAAGYRPRQQTRCCTVLCFLLCGGVILAVLAGEFLLPSTALPQMLRTHPVLLLWLELYRCLVYLGNAALGLLLCRVTQHPDVILPIGTLFLTAETLPTLSKICVILPSGSISPLLFGAAPALSMVHGLVESIILLLLCFLPIGKEVTS